MLSEVASLPAEPDLWQHLPVESLLTLHPGHFATYKDAASLQLAAKGSASLAQLLLALLVKTAAEQKDQLGYVRPIIHWIYGLAGVRYLYTHSTKSPSIPWPSFA